MNHDRREFIRNSALLGVLGAVPGRLLARENPQGTPAGSGPPSASDGLPKTRLVASDPASWRPVNGRVATPTGGVTLADDGLFAPVMRNNIAYLLGSFSVDHMLVPFRQRAGHRNPPDDHADPMNFWDTDLRGANAGRFLMGAGNTLRWVDHPELRGRLDALIDGIEACRAPNGYVLAFASDLPFRCEEPNYGRAWFTHGLIEAGIAGNPKAFALLRGHADWFNQWNMLPDLIYYSNNSHQGHIASTRTYFSPVGKPEDLQVAEKYYVMDWWIDALAARREEAVWRFPLQNPHSYLITSFEAYLDHYRATGDRRFLEAMLGAWDLIHDRWEHVGGSMAICETEWHRDKVTGERVLPEPGYPPGSYFLKRDNHTGETCGSVFWIKFNQRFHQLYPDEEKYTAEIEKSLYNVCLANQLGGTTIRYHAFMQGKKDFAGDPHAASVNTCCEGQGTRLYGSLPEYIYSVAPDGLYVNLYEGSRIRWKQGGRELALQMTTAFPFEPHVALRIQTAAPLRSTLRLRIPSWAAAPVPLQVNGSTVGFGRPGTYHPIERDWAHGDTISFTLPMDFRVTPYVGSDQIAGHRRFAIEYGPVLLAAVGPLDVHSALSIAHRPEDVRNWLKPQPGRPLHFAIDGHAEHEFLPYWEIGEQTFCVTPVMGPPVA
jgi:uncharacterized protein